MHILSGRTFVVFFILECLLLGLLKLSGEIPAWGWFAASAVLFIALWLRDHWQAIKQRVAPLIQGGKVGLGSWYFIFSCFVIAAVAIAAGAYGLGLRSVKPSDSVARTELATARTDLEFVRRQLEEARRPRAAIPTPVLSVPADAVSQIGRALILREALDVVKLERENIAQKGEILLNFKKKPVNSGGQAQTFSSASTSLGDSLTSFEKQTKLVFPNRDMDLRTIPILENPHVKVPGDDDITDDALKHEFRRYYVYLHHHLLRSVDRIIPEIEMSHKNAIKAIENLPEAKIIQGKK